MSTNAEAPEIVEEEAPAEPAGKPDPKATDTGKQEATQPKQHPWTKDLEEALSAEDPSDALNQLMLRSQSYTTGVEQELSQYREMFGGNVEVAQLGAGILMSLENEPMETLVKIAAGVAVDEEGKPVFDPDDLLTALEDHFYPDGVEEGDEQPAGPPAEDSPDGDDSEPLTPEQEWIQQKMAEESLEDHRTTYRAILDGIHAELPGFDEERFHMLVSMHGGELEAAFDDYVANWHKETPTSKPAPPSTPGASSLPPAEAKEYTGFGEAADDFLSELRVSRS